MKKIVIAIALAALVATPAVGQTSQRQTERVERTVRTQTPYSNEQVAKRRALRDTVREIERENRGPYRFRSLREREPRN